MTIQHTETLQRLWKRFSRDQLAGIPPEERREFEQQFEDRFAELVQGGADAPAGGDGFLDLIGFGGKGPVAFEEMSYPYIQPDFDDSVVPSQLHAAAELYFIYQYERSKVFQVVDVLRRLFHHGRLRMNRGPGARGLYLLEKWQPLRYSPRQRETRLSPRLQLRTESRRGRARSSIATSIASSSASWCRSPNISATC